ncbi:MAG: hypothetical protein GY950_15250, partial [bacterium]|nr:hypothetical protein [bacterium]
MASSVAIHSGKLINNFTIPGIKTRGGDTGVRFIYNSATAYPSSYLNISEYQDELFVAKPDRSTVEISSPLLYDNLSTGTGIKILHFNQIQKYGNGGIILSGDYPSGRKVKTGYQKVAFSYTNYYNNSVYALVTRWAGAPEIATQSQSQEPAYHTKEEEIPVFMVSRGDSSFGKGWWLEGFKKLHIDSNRAVVIDPNGNYTEFEKSTNYANLKYNASVSYTSHTLLNPDSVLVGKNIQKAKNMNPSRFEYQDIQPQGTDQV